MCFSPSEEQGCAKLLEHERSATLRSGPSEEQGCAELLQRGRKRILESRFLERNYAHSAHVADMVAQHRRDRA